MLCLAPPLSSTLLTPCARMFVPFRSRSQRFITGHWWRCQSPKIYRISLSPDYMLLCWNQRQMLDTISPEYYLRLIDSELFERAHVVSGFQRKIGSLELPGVPTTSIGHHWTSAVIMRVYHSKRKFALPKTDKVSHTHRIAGHTDANPLYIWGPFTTDMSRQIHEAMHDITAPGMVQLCLVGSGSGICFLIDAIQEFVDLGMDGAQSLCVLYTCRDGQLFRYVTRLIESILGAVRVHERSILSRLRIILNLTDSRGELKAVNAPIFDHEEKSLIPRIRDRAPYLFMDASAQAEEANVDDGDGSSFHHKSLPLPALDTVLRLRYGRMHFDETMPSKSLVFVQGSGSVQRMVAVAAKAKGCTLMSGPAFDAAPDAGQKNGTSRLNHCLPLPCCMAGGAQVAPPSRASTNLTDALNASPASLSGNGEHDDRPETSPSSPSTVAFHDARPLVLEDVDDGAEDPQDKPPSPVQKLAGEAIQRVRRVSKEAKTQVMNVMTSSQKQEKEKHLWDVTEEFPEEVTPLNLGEGSGGSQ